MGSTPPGVPPIFPNYLMNDVFRKVAAKVSNWMGSPWTFIIALLLIVIWIITGPIFHFSDTWQLVINTATTIITFLMVFLIQNTQNRDTRAIHLKLDELLRGVQGARTGLVDLENLTDEELEKLQAEFRRLHETHHLDLTGGNQKLAGTEEKKNEN